LVDGWRETGFLLRRRVAARTQGKKPGFFGLLSLVDAEIFFD
jgi:hypothetical protein